MLQRFRPVGPPRSGRRSAGSWLGLATRLTLAALLIALHGLLFVRRVADGSITDPTVALKWAASAALLVFATRWLAIGLRSARGPASQRTQTLVFWLLVAVLHAGFPVVPATAESALAETSHTALPATWFTEMANLAAALGVLLAAAALAATATTATTRPDRFPLEGPWTGLGIDGSRPLAARPPPAALLSA